MRASRTAASWVWRSSVVDVGVEAFWAAVWWVWRGGVLGCGWAIGDVSLWFGWIRCDSFSAAFLRARTLLFST